MSAGQPEPKLFQRFLKPFTTPYIGAFLVATSFGIGLYTVLVLNWGAGYWLALPRVSVMIRTYTAIAATELIAHFVAFLRVLRRADEFLRAVAFKRVTVAAILTLLVITIWGLFANAGATPPFPAMLAYALFALINLFVLFFINADRP